MELLGSGPAGEAAVTAGYTGADGQSHEVSATTTVGRIESQPSGARLHVDSLDVVRWFEGGSWTYWPRLTVAEVTGQTTVTITRIEFNLPDLGSNGRVPPSFGSWMVPAGGTRDLFHETYRDEPNTAVSSSHLTDRFRITLSYVDAAGRPGDATAETLALPR